MKLEKEFIFYSDRLVGVEFFGQWLEIYGGRCLIRKDAVADGATLARDENAYYTWFWHDNSYAVKIEGVSRLTKDLVMYDMLKVEGFRWFRWKWLKKIFKNYNGINMIWVYFLGVRLFGWAFHVK